MTYVKDTRMVFNNIIGFCIGYYESCYELYLCAYRNELDMCKCGMQKLKAGLSFEDFAKERLATQEERRNLAYAVGRTYNIPFENIINFINLIVKIEYLLVLLEFEGYEREKAKRLGVEKTEDTIVNIYQNLRYADVFGLEDEELIERCKGLDEMELEYMFKIRTSESHLALMRFDINSLSSLPDEEWEQYVRQLKQAVLRLK